MFSDVILIISGILFLVLGGEGLVRGSISFAKMLRLSTLLISTVIIGFGTSLPELVVSVQASLQGSTDIALGNVVGSNICNVLIVLGFSSVIYTVKYTGHQIRRDALVGFAAAVFLAALSFLGEIGRFAGSLMIFGLVVYLVYCIRHERKNSGVNVEEIAEVHYKPAVAAVMVVGGIALLLLGSKVLVMGAINIATKLGVSEAVIGLTVVAVGTSLPELVTAVVSAYRKHTDVIIGNVLGSNLFNIMGILGITSLIQPIKYEGHIAEKDVWVMLVTAFVLLISILIRKKANAIDGLFMLLSYSIYIVFVISA